MIIAILLLGMLITIGIGVPVGWALGISGLIAIHLMGVSLNTVPQKIFAGMDIFVLMCIPFFILAGEIMAKGGLTRRLLLFADVAVGSIRGGLAQANVVASMLFGGITGSAIADASALGTVEIPMMRENGYDAEFAAAVTAASSCIGPIIPPSIPVVIYSMAVGGVSIGALFAAGIIPGLIVGIALMLTCYIFSLKRGYPKRKHRISARQFLRAFRDAFFAIMTPVIILGGIIGGVFSPTEAAAVAVVYSFGIAFWVYKEIKFADLPTLFIRTGVTSAIVMIIIGTSNIFGFVVALEQVAQRLAELLEPLGYVGFILMINVIFLIVGSFLDNNPAILIMAPIFAPIAANLGIDPVHFGVIVVMNLVIGLITPPLGEVLFIVGPIAGVSFEKCTIAVLPFLLVELGGLLLVSYIPALTLFIPRLLGY